MARRSVAQEPAEVALSAAAVLRLTRRRLVGGAGGGTGESRAESALAGGGSEGWAGLG